MANKAERLPSTLLKRDLGVGCTSVAPLLPRKSTTRSNFHRGNRASVLVYTVHRLRNTTNRKRANEKQVQVDDYRSKHGTTRKYRHRRNRSSWNIAAVRTCDSFRFSGSSVPVITLQIRDRPGSPRRRTSSTSSRRHAFNRLLRRCVPLVAAWAPVFVDSVFLIGFVIFDAPSARTNWFPSSQARMLFLWLSSRTSGPHNRFFRRNRSLSRTATSASPVFGTPTKGSAAWESSVACTRAYALHFTAAAAES